MYSLKKDVFLFKALILTYLAGNAVGQVNPEDYDYNLDEVKWGLTNDNKTDTCILLNGILQVIVSYNTQNVLMKGLTLLTVPRNASVYGTCGYVTQNMTLAWNPRSGIEENEPPTNQHRLTLTFVKKGAIVGDSNNSFSDPYYELYSIDGVFYAGEAEFPDFNRAKTQYTLETKNLGMLSAPLQLSYFCQSTQVIYSENEDATSLVLSYLQAEAFHRGLSDTAPDGVDFGARSYCPKDGFQMIFTVVGYVAFFAVLGAIIFFILSRRRTRTGYVYL